MESSLRLGPAGPANIAITTPFIDVRLTLYPYLELSMNLKVYRDER